jgi:hypothetical protein
MTRLVANQKKRRAILVEKFKDDPEIDIHDERTFYNPKYFKKEIIQSEQIDEK